MDVRNFTYMVYGYSAAWLIIVGFVFLLVSRSRKIDGELKRLKSLVEDRESEPSSGLRFPAHPNYSALKSS